MPAGVSWPVYFKSLIAACISMALGSQTVHLIYRPIDDLDEMVKKEKERILQERDLEKNPEYLAKREKILKEMGVKM